MILKKKITSPFLIFIGCVSGCIFITPVLLTIYQSFLSDNGITVKGYMELFFNCFPFYRFFWNSSFYTVVIAIGTLLVSVPAAFAFRFAQFPGKKLFFIIYIILMMMPLQVMILPNYIGLRELSLLNTPMAIILPAIFSPLGAIVIHQYIRECDINVVEAARLETNSCVLIIIHCIIPQIKVCVFAVTLLVFADVWNMVEQPMLYLNEDRWRMLSTFIIQSDLFSMEVLLPASVLFMVPVFLCYLLYHKELKQGLKM